MTDEEIQARNVAAAIAAEILSEGGRRKLSAFEIANITIDAARFIVMILATPGLENKALKASGKAVAVPMNCRPETLSEIRAAILQNEREPANAE